MGRVDSWTPEMRARAAGLKRAGFSNATIANKLGVSERSVKAHMHKMKVRRRLDGHGGRDMGGFAIGSIGLHLTEVVTTGVKEDDDDQ